MLMTHILCQNTSPSSSKGEFVMSSTDNIHVAKIQAAEAITTAMVSKWKLDAALADGEGETKPEKLGNAAGQVHKAIAKAIDEAEL
jgi:hypothetical protein